MSGSPFEIAVVLVVLFALFGGTIIPKLTKRIKETKKAAKEGLEEIKGE